MSSKKGVVWEAAPHTIAKIAILKSYLSVWLSVIGRTFNGKDLWYIDGFAGPGEYTNYDEGSPIAILRIANEVLQKTTSWRAGRIRLVFVEEGKARFDHLKELVSAQTLDSRIDVHLIHGTFEAGISELKTKPGNPLSNGNPLFSFIDPFGPTDIPFALVRELLSKNASEVLINFDSDGAIRVLKAGADANHEENLNALFGCGVWKNELPATMDTAQASRKAAALYLRCLRALPKIDFGYGFEMRSKAGAIDYHLVFASQHRLGLEKMKEVMKQIDQTGEYSFCDSHVGQQVLFRSDNPPVFAREMASHFSGRNVSYEDTLVYALNETPFTNPKGMLKILETEGTITITSSKAGRKKGTFPDGSVSSIRFE